MTNQTPAVGRQDGNQSCLAQIIIGVIATILGGIAVELFIEMRTDQRNTAATASAIIAATNRAEDDFGAGSSSDDDPPQEPRPTATHTPRPQVVDIQCPNARGPSFAIGERFIVPYGDGASGLFPEPNQEPKLGEVQEGDGGEIIGGPVCKIGTKGFHNDGKGALIIWRVQTDQPVNSQGDRVGWMAEGYPESPVPWIEPDD